MPSATVIVKQVPAGRSRRPRFTVAGQTVLCTDSVVKHKFTSPALSLFVTYASEEGIQRLTGALSEHGTNGIRQLRI